MRKTLLIASLCFWATSAVALETASLHYGYIDQRPDDSVIDGAEASATLSLLTRSCGTETLLCGFQFVADDGFRTELFRPDLARGPVTVLIHTSSATRHDPTNRSSMSGLQAQKSARAQAAFESATLSADALFYIGHARYGGGPDFEPPRLRANGATDSGWHRRHDENFRRWLSILPSSPARALGVFACDSDDHFRRRLQSAYAGHLWTVEGARRPSEMNGLLWQALRSWLGAR